MFLYDEYFSLNLKPFCRKWAQANPGLFLVHLSSFQGTFYEIVRVEGEFATRF